MKPRNEKGQYIKTEWTPEEVALLVELYPDTLTNIVAEKLGKSLYAVRNKVSNLGLKKSRNFMVENGRRLMVHPVSIANRYKKGRASENKGKKQTEFCSPEGIERSKATRFKKGQLPHNTKEIGYERVDNEGYILIKTELRGKLKLKHREVWKQHYGSIPKGHNVQFKDGNRQNCAIENLYLISRNEQVRKNSILNLPLEVRTAYRAIGNIKKEINKQKKGAKNETN